jgi:glutaminase
MPTQEIRQRVNQRLEELYEQHLALHEDEIVAYYAPGSGYQKPDTLESDHQRFAICLATTDGEIFCVGDHDRPFTLQSISKLGYKRGNRSTEQLRFDPQASPFAS